MSRKACSKHRTEAGNTLPRESASMSEPPGQALSPMMPCPPVASSPAHNWSTIGPTSAENRPRVGIIGPQLPTIGTQLARNWPTSSASNPQASEWRRLNAFHLQASEWRRNASNLQASGTPKTTEPAKRDTQSDASSTSLYAKLNFWRWVCAFKRSTVEQAMLSQRVATRVLQVLLLSARAIEREVQKDAGSLSTFLPAEVA